MWDAEEDEWRAWALRSRLFFTSVVANFKDSPQLYSHRNPKIGLYRGYVGIMVGAI